MIQGCRYNIFLRHILYPDPRLSEMRPQLLQEERTVPSVHSCSISTRLFKVKIQGKEKRSKVFLVQGKIYR